MRKNINDEDEGGEVNESRERRMHERTLNKYRNLDVNIRAQEMEALENEMHRTSKAAMKKGNTKNTLAKDFLEKHRGEQQPNANLISFLRGSSGGSFGGVNNANYEPDPTGMEVLPWDEEED